MMKSIARDIHATVHCPLSTALRLLSKDDMTSFVVHCSLFTVHCSLPLYCQTELLAD